MVKIQISSDKKMGKVKTMVLPAKRNSDKKTKTSNKSALTTESKSYIKKAKSKQSKQHKNKPKTTIPENDVFLISSLSIFSLL